MATSESAPLYTYDVEKATHDKEQGATEGESLAYDEEQGTADVESIAYDEEQGTVDVESIGGLEEIGTVDEESIAADEGRNRRTRTKQTYTINIEWFRFVGLASVGLLLGMGKFVTHFFNNWPLKENPSSPFDKIFRGAPTDMEYTETFIYKLFNFNHTCSLLDFNPSKTVAGLIIMIHELPLLLFIVFHYWRVQGMTSPAFNKLKIFSKIASPLQFIFILYFYMVFVNAPDGDFGTREGMTLFVLHYIPYMLWQIGVLLMAIQQSWYLCLSDTIPFDWITQKELWYYTVSMIIVCIVYNVFIWSFIMGDPLWDTTQNPGRAIAQTIMWVWNFYAVFIPAYFSYRMAKVNGACSELVFQELFES